MTAAPSLAAFQPNPIRFGTDGWRGIIAADFTFERVAQVASAAAQVLASCYSDKTPKSTIIIGYDRRFLSPEFARVAAEAVTQAGYDVLLSKTYAPTPAFSWAAKHQQALGALVITASHNPAIYSGIKVKGAFGGSVPPEITQQVEAQLEQPSPMAEHKGALSLFDPWPDYCQALRSCVDVEAIQKSLSSGQVTLFADVMHGAASGGLSKLLGDGLVHELNGSADPTFGGGAPEPLPKYIADLLQTVANHQPPLENGCTVGLVFDGDSDRIAAVDGSGKFLSSQVLIPILIEHLTTRRGYQGEVVKTISGSNLIPALTQLYGLPLHETPIGYKYIADRMLASSVLLGGEESGGIGYGHHIPERDALLSALYVLEAVVMSGLDLSDLYRALQEKTGFSSAYDRIDLPLATMEVRAKLLDSLQSQPPKTIAGKPVQECLTIDGYKFILADGSWLLIRFSGTEPVLRLYSEASTLEAVHAHLAWAKDWANAIGDNQA